MRGDGVRERLLAESGAHVAEGVARDFGDPAAEHRAVREGAGLFDLSARDRLRVHGLDASGFLNRLLTARVERLPVGAGNRAFLLNSTGKVLSVFHLLRVGQHELWLECRHGLGTKTAEALDFYLFAEQVAIDPLQEEQSLLSLQGPAAADRLRGLGVEPPDGPWRHHPATIGGAAVRVAQVDRTGSGGFDLWVAPDDLERVWRALIDAGARPAGADALETLRVEAGLPAWGHEYTETVIPLEASGEIGIDEGKGCYPGQEVIERIISLGRPPRALVGLTLSGRAAPGDEVTLDGRPVGALTSFATLPDGTHVGLALIKRRAAEDGEGALAAGGVPATRRPLPAAP